LVESAQRADRDERGQDDEDRGEERDPDQR